MPMPKVLFKTHILGRTIVDGLRSQGDDLLFITFAFQSCRVVYFLRTGQQIGMVFTT